MLLPSMGLTCGTFCSKEATLTSGTRTTVPESVAGSSAWMSFVTATIDAYSVPCAPETSARTGPGFVPRTTATAMDVPGSTPAGTSIVPKTFFPATAVAVPTEKTFACGVAAKPCTASAIPKAAQGTHLFIGADSRFSQGYRKGPGVAGAFESTVREALWSGLHAAGYGVGPLPLV